MRHIARRVQVRWSAAVVVLIGLLVGVLAIGGHPALDQPAEPSHQLQSRADTTASLSPRAPAVPPGVETRGDTVVAAQLDRMRHLAPVAPLAAAERRITGDARTQPDLYAAEFVRRLLTQDFRTSRGNHVAWVQSESTTTTEPLVVGLVPAELRDRLTVFTVTDDIDGNAVIPTTAAWARLATRAAYDTATVEQVIEPLAWRNAVAAGRVTDPSITCRIVAATVTRHELIGGEVTTTLTSVSVTLNIAGPPTGATWAFVAVIDVTTLPMGTS